jgi:Na+/melibiose symporter-like transporter
MQSEIAEDDREVSVDLGDPVHVKERNKRVQQRQRELADTLVQIMSTKQGRAWMHHLVYDKCGYDKKQFTGNSATYANVGVLEVGQTIVRELKTLCFEQWALMEREALEK